MAAALPAFAAEAIFYLTCGFERARAWWQRPSGPLLLWGSAILPYLVFSLAAGTFSARAFYLLAALCALAAFWSRIIPQRFIYDVAFLVVAATPIISGVFRRIYVSPDPHVRADILGHIMWIRLAIIAFLVFRRWNPGAFTFWPNAREWKTGVVWFLLAIVPLATLAWLVRDAHPIQPHGDWWKVTAVGVGTFFGFLWVIAFGEELFFRGVVERALLNFKVPPAASVAASAVLFGSAHLWFHAFPNWPRVAVASCLGLACGMAYLQTNSVRAPMVTHALVVATWRVCFRDY